MQSKENRGHHPVQIIRPTNVKPVGDSAHNVKKYQADHQVADNFETVKITSKKPVKISILFEPKWHGLVLFLVLTFLAIGGGVAIYHRGYNGITKDTLAASPLPSYAPITIPTNPSIIKMGSSGNDVKALQLALNALGYGPFQGTGYFGTLTNTEVRKFQSDKSLNVDGIVGKITWQALRTAFGVSVPVPTPTPASAIINAKDKGVKGDGITDNAAILNQLLANNPGKTIYLPAGNYYISAPLAIKSNTSLCGAGDTSVISIKSDIRAVATSLADKVVLCSLAIKGQGPVTGTKSDAVVFSGVSNSRIEKLSISGFPHHCLIVNSSSSNVQLAYNRIDSCGGGATGTGIGVSGGSTNIVVRNNTVSNSRLGISVNGVRDVLITNNEVMHNYQYGFGVDSHDNHFVRLINNYAHENGGREWTSLTTFSQGKWTSHPVINGPAFKALNSGKTGSSEKLPSFWRANRVYLANEYIYQSNASAFNGCEYRATVSGTSGGTEPLWTALMGGKVVDGSVTWICEKPRTSIVDGSITWQLAGTGQTADYYGGFYIGVENGYLSDNVSISGNTSNTNLGYGIKVDGYSRDNLFMSNIFVANNTTNSNSQNGIRIDYVNSLKVSGNQAAYNAKTSQIYIGTNQLPYHN